MSAIEQFIAAVYSDAAMQRRLGAFGNAPHAIAAFARGEGFDVGGDALQTFIDAQLETRLTAAQKAQRAACLERGSGIVSIDATSLASRVDTIDGRNAVTLDRAALFAGQLTIVERLPALAVLVAYLRTVLTSAFGGVDPIAAHPAMDEEAYFACVRAADDALLNDPAIPALTAALAGALGFFAQVHYFGPFLRHNLPSPAAGGTIGYFAGVQVRVVSRDNADARSPVINAHRDTWFGAPFHQINLWAPVYDYPAGSGMSIAQHEFARPLRNNTEGFDVWRAKLGLALGPMALDDVDWSTSFDVNLPAGDLICFSANHFHGTGLNPGHRPRVSFELRFASDEDRAAGRAAPNVDFGGVGELEGFRSVNVARI